MSDYTDWTDSIELLGSEIQLPVDLQGAYIQLPVDIQGQYVNLAVDVVAQSIGSIAVDIAAQSVDKLAVDIKAQSIGNLNVNLAASAVTLNISISAQSVGIYLQSDWSAVQGTDKNLRGYITTPGVMGGIVISYTVSNGKSLMICSATAAFGFISPPSAGWDTWISLALYDSTSGVWLCNASGLGGCTLIFNKPIKVSSGHQVNLYGWTIYANTFATLVGSLWGYEI